MLVPLQTLFGWPEAPAVTPLEALGLLGGIPLVVIVLVFAVAKGHAALDSSRHGSGPRDSDPVWMGGRATSVMGGADVRLGLAPDQERPQLEGSSQGRADRFPSTAAPEADTGGASARW